MSEIHWTLNGNHGKTKKINVKSLKTIVIHCFSIAFHWFMIGILKCFQCFCIFCCLSYGKLWKSTGNAHEYIEIIGAESKPKRKQQKSLGKQGPKY